MPPLFDLLLPDFSYALLKGLGIFIGAYAVIIILFLCYDKPQRPLL